MVRYMEEQMVDSSEPGAKPGQGSLWTTPAAVGSSPLSEAKVDPSVSKQQICEALEGVKGRARAFAGKVPEQVLRASVG